MKHILKVFNFLILIFLFQFCNESPVTQDTDAVKVTVKSIVPAHPLKIGEKFKMIIKVENLDTALVDHRFYINDQFHYDNTVNKDTIFTYLPYITNNSIKWMIKVSAYTYNGSDYKYYYGLDTLDVIPENCPSNVCTKWSDLDSIYEYDSYYHPEYFGDQYKWDCESSGDTITFIQVTPGCDEGYEKVKLELFNNGSNFLPEFISLTKFVYCSSTELGDTLKSGIIKIQDWDTSGIVSGIILSELKPIQILKPDLPTRRVFWFNFHN